MTKPSIRRLPKYTVCYNIASPENSKWVGTGWEFFDSEDDAKTACERHTDAGNYPTRRAFHTNDIPHLGAAHLYWLDKKKNDANRRSIVSSGKTLYKSPISGKWV